MEFAMAEQYFVKRGETVKGPFSLKKIQQLEAAKKLKANDLIGTNESGPWERVTAYNRILSSAQRGTIPVVATIEAWKVKRGLLGQFQVNFKCPGCKAELKSDENEISQRDYCPGCGKAFVLDQRVAAEISSRRDRLAADKESRNLAKQERKRENEKERDRKYFAKQERKRENEKRKREDEERKREEDKERPQPQVPQKTTTAGPTNDISESGVVSAGCFVFFVIGGLIFLSSLDYDYGSLLKSAIQGLAGQGNQENQADQEGQADQGNQEGQADQGKLTALWNESERLERWAEKIDLADNDDKNYDLWNTYKEQRDILAKIEAIDPGSLQPPLNELPLPSAIFTCELKLLSAKRAYNSERIIQGRDPVD